MVALIATTFGRIEMKDLTALQYFCTFGWKPMVAMIAGMVIVIIAYHKEGLFR